jgi:peptide deformylase
MNEIVQVGDPVLRQVAQEVPDTMFGTPELAAIIDGMAQTLEAQTDGVALAAPQVGISYRIFIVRYDRMLPETEKRPADLGVFINPEFVNSSRRREVMEEGCLSVRGTYGRTYRHERVTVRARRTDGTYFERGGGGMLAQAFQHETDHLDGILFIDYAIETRTTSETEALPDSEDSRQMYA